MKILKRLIVAMVMALAAAAIATAETVAPGTTQTAASATATAAPSIMAWFQANQAAIFGLALAISEFLALIPAFKGNGILDTIIKALKLLTGKDTSLPTETA